MCTVLWDQELTLILVLLLFSELLFEFSTCPPTDKVDCIVNYPLGNILCRSSGGQWPVLSTKGLLNGWDSSLRCCQAPGESFGYNLLLYSRSINSNAEEIGERSITDNQLIWVACKLGADNLHNYVFTLQFSHVRCIGRNTRNGLCSCL